MDSTNVQICGDIDKLIAKYRGSGTKEGQMLAAILYIFRAELAKGDFRPFAAHMTAWVYQEKARLLAEAEELGSPMSDGMIVVNGSALACSERVQSEVEHLRARLAVANSLLQVASVTIPAYYAPDGWQESVSEYLETR